MAEYDVIVIGGGILGCMTARNLRRWNISTLVLEQQEDVCTGITRANSAIVYAGYDNKPGSLKAELTVQGNANMEQLCRELNVPFSRCGSLLVTYDEASISKLEKKLNNAVKNSVPGARLISGAEAEEMEPMLNKGVKAALFAPSTGTVNPWQLGIAAMENAMQNGAELKLNCCVSSIHKTETGYCIETNQGKYHCNMVINCAGLYADRVQDLIYEPATRLKLDGAEYMVFDRTAQKPDRVIFHQADSCGKGITAIPCVEGNILISGVRKDLGNFFETTYHGVQEMHSDARALLPELDLNAVIRSFGAVRPNPYQANGKSLGDFCIEMPAPNFISLIGVKTPGLTCSNELGLYVAQKCAEYLSAKVNPGFDPVRKNFRIPQTGESEIICQCEGITKREILDAIAAGATTVEMVKRRAGSGMGRCQGGRCGWRIWKILKETGVNPEPVI